MVDLNFYTREGPFCLKDLAVRCDAVLDVRAHPDLEVSDVGVLNSAQQGDITFISKPNKKYLAQLATTKATACFISRQLLPEAPDHLHYLITDKPRRSYAQAAQLFYPDSVIQADISPQAVVHPSAKIGEGCIVGPFAVIEENAILGTQCTIGPYTQICRCVRIGQRADFGSHISISHAHIGEFVTIQSGARIGQAGFGFEIDSAGHINIPQLGRVLIGNHVFIGANAAIDRGACDDTKIGNNVRIDNFVNIAHNVCIGDHSILVAQVGIAGTTTLGRGVIAAGQVGIADNVTIGNGVQIAAKSGIMRDVKDGEKIGGIPAVSIRDWHRRTFMLDEMIKKWRRVS